MAHQIILAQDYTEADFEKSIDQGERLMEAGYYEQADEAFMFVLDNKKVLPSEMAYLFGRNSFHLGKYKQSINWLNKYIQLRGAKARYYDEAVKYLGMAEESYRTKTTSSVKAGTGSSAVEEELVLASSEFDCGGLEKMVCPVCRGSGVIITKGAFDPQYKTCPLSKGEGFISCEDYNLFMSGRLLPGQ
jgi:tetratricopeptide (TPR) repeat protein